MTSVAEGPAIGPTRHDTERLPMDRNYLAEQQMVAELVTAPALSVPPAPKGGTPAAVRQWFNGATEVILPAAADTLGAEQDAAEAFQRLAKSENTRRAYRAAVAAWCGWCAARGVSPLPAASHDVAAFIAGERIRGLKANTLDLRRAGIRYLHRSAGCSVPTDDVCVSETIAGIRRQAAQKGEMPRKKAGATAGIIEQFIAPIPDDLRGLRDRALILVGFVGALRRSELAAIDVLHLQKFEKGVRLVLPHTKGSQTVAVAVPLPYGRTQLCPVRALERWLEAAKITEGPVFRRIWLSKKTNSVAPPPLPQTGHTPLTTQAIATIIKARAAAAGFNPDDFGGHSLKRGALTTGMQQGEHPAKLKRLGRHKSFDVLGEYLEVGDLFDNHPLKGVV